MTTTAPSSDVFISYNRRDTSAAEQIARALTERGLSVFLDRWTLQPGTAWTPALEAALAECGTVLVLVGPGGMSDWQRSESDLALDRQRRGDDVRVVPVIVPGGDPPLGFLRLNTWVDLRDGLDAPPLLDVLAAIARGESRGVQPALCPYRGLRPYRFEDAAFFFGRDDFVVQALAAVRARPVSVVVGASGAGKSSAIRAGLLPALVGDVREQWSFVVMRPGREPFHALAANLDSLLDRTAGDAERLVRAREIGEALASGRLTVGAVVGDALARTAGDRSVLLLVDQWEELYTQCGDAGVRERFIEAVLDAAHAGAIRLLLTVRGDFFDDVLATRRLADALEGGILSLAPMSRDELRACIEQPAARVGLSFEAGLVERLLDDVEGGAGSLPLLAFVLAELWEHRRGAALTHQAYDAMGGLQGALAQRAETEYAKLDDAEREAVRNIMLECVHIATGSVDARRRATRPEIGEEAWPVVLTLADARLLVTSIDDATDIETVEVAHEALIRHWARLRSWVDEDREFLLWRQRLHHAVQEHDRPGTGGDAALLRGGLLDEALRWSAARPDRLSERDRAFIAASARRARGQRIRRRVNVLVLAGVAVGLIAASAAWLRAQNTNRRAREARILDAAAGAADPAVAALLIAELDADREPRSGASVARRIADRAIPLAVLDRSAGSAVTALAPSPDGARMLVAYEDGEILLWPADGGGAPQRAATAAAAVWDVSFDPSGALWLALDDTGAPHLGRAAGGDEIRPWGNGHPGEVVFVRFAGPDDVVTVGADGTIRGWSVSGDAEPQVIGRAPVPVTAVTLAPDGSHIATASGRIVEVRPLRGGPVLRLTGHADRITTIAFDARAGRVATASWDGTVRLYAPLETGSGREVHASTAAIWSIAFDTDGTALTTAGQAGMACVIELDGAATPVCQDAVGPVREASFQPGSGAIAYAGTAAFASLWSGRPGTGPIELRGHTGPVSFVRWTADGSRLATGSSDGTVRVWRGRGGGDPVLFRPPRAEAAPFWAAAVDGSGQLVALAAESGVAWLWRPAQDTAWPLRGHEQAVATLSFDPRNDRLVTGAWDGTARVWSVDGAHVAVIDGNRGAVRAARFSPAADLLVTGGDDGALRLARGPRFDSPRELYRHTGMVRDLVFLTDGSAVVSASADSTAASIDLGGRGQAIVLRHRGAVRSVDASSDRPILVTASEDGTAVVWSAEGDTALVLRHDGPVFSARFDAAGVRIVTASADQTARVWDLTRGGEQTVLRGHRRDVRGARFSHDSRRVVTFSNDSTALVHRLDGAAEPVRLAGHAGAVREALFLPGDERLVTVSEDGAARVWSVGWRALHERLATSTSVCLSPTVRERALDESPDEARARYERCERAHGRAPLEGR